jgi:AbrB family looped-hinge helix DNA binding protein
MDSLIHKSDNKEYRKVQGLVGESSFSIVLPKSFANALGIGKGDFVKVYSTEDKKIVVEKAQQWRNGHEVFIIENKPAEKFPRLTQQVRFKDVSGI